MSLSKQVLKNGKNCDAFLEKCHSEGCNKLLLVKVVVTHWNSHAECLLHMLHLQLVVNWICADCDLKLQKYMFAADEWEILEKLETILKVCS
jgi:hypothetical protein